jgi:uncharacterized low-complexity protein
MFVILQFEIKRKKIMNKLFVLSAVFLFSFPAMTQTPARTNQTQTPARVQQIQSSTQAKQDTIARRKSCADWIAEGKCPKANDGGRCSDHKASGKCPRVEPKKNTTTTNNNRR